MLIEEMFVKAIDREIGGVVKVGLSDLDNADQELEEYVVTRELQRHFADFFAGYKKGINDATDKMGVWISGFFGSGKSHFLKILSYLLENREVNGKKAIDYFIDDHKISNPAVLTDMRLAAGIAADTDVILFNIDSKSEIAGGQPKDAIVSVFLKAFNEMQGFCSSMPFLADLERDLDESGRYGEFRSAFEADYGKPWEATRHRFDFIQDSMVRVLVSMGFMSEAAARNWCERAAEPYQVSIENFAKLVKEYIDRKGGNHHVVFLVDEIGQYIGGDSKLMLNLQTLTEDLGTACRGKAWVIVTSQQDVDSVTRGMDPHSNDFSKIQGRFDTRLSLSAANAGEVIRKRILEKKPAAGEELRLLYEQKSTTLKNLIVFNGTIEKKLYTDDMDFASVYPFVPYQFDLLGSVLTSIRMHGAFSGRHLSDGARSMLALYQESAMTLKDKKIGALVPFYLFYDALHPFLDCGPSGAIPGDPDNGGVNPEYKENEFSVRVLKTLFMMKQAGELAANVDNITSLMIDSIDTDRIALKKKVENALKVLVNQMLVQKNGDSYVFLTDEEQEINHEIEAQNIETADVLHKVSELIFDDIYREAKYRYPGFYGRYSFAFNRIVDDCFYKSNQSYDIGVRVLTPDSGYAEEETTLRMMSGQGREVLVVLPEDSAFLDELRASLKIEKYLRQPAAGTPVKYEQIKEAKRVELRERNANTGLFLTEAIKNAEIYVNGDRAQIASTDAAARIHDALGRLVTAVYHKLPYIDMPVNKANIRALFDPSAGRSPASEDGEEPNIHAVTDMLNFIASNSAAHRRTSMESLMERFRKAPYGFAEDDVEWLAARLFKNGDIAFSIGGVNLLNKSEGEIIRYITKKEYRERLLIERREKSSESQKKSVRDVMRELFGLSVTSEDDDAVMQDFQRCSRDLLRDLDGFEEKQKEKALPGGQVVTEGQALLHEVLRVQSATEFFQKIHDSRDDYLNFAEDYEPVKSFFTGEQRMIYERALRLMSIYDDSRNFIVNKKIETLAVEIKSVLHRRQPYSEIPKLPELLDQFHAEYGALLRAAAEPVKEEAAQALTRVYGELKGKRCEKLLADRCADLFQELEDKISSCRNMARLQSVRVEIDALKLRLLNEIPLREQELMEAERKKSPVKSDAPPAPPAPKPKRQKNISMKSMDAAMSWQIESERDVDRHLAALRERLVRELEQDTVVNVEF